MSLSLTPNAVALWRNTFACQPGSVVPSQVREGPISKADDKNRRLARGHWPREILTGLWISFERRCWWPVYKPSVNPITKSAYFAALGVEPVRGFENAL